MGIKEKIWEIIDEYDGSGKIDECSEEIKDFMNSLEDVATYEIYTDTDVYDSCGLDIYYISIAWYTTSGNLNVCGSRLTSH